ncbi:hypothetical protein B7P43_G15327 [Cryptotermes secundus]|uniref:Uncharacterized protein n=1 Tax=Cryptotermes secundus TaxID=105785 RepID=A0A2J7PYJ1_9NEOP|nr:hypothetical protein B7P43_G15327 [Cryptotermes secundus]
MFQRNLLPPSSGQETKPSCRNWYEYRAQDYSLPLPVSVPLLAMLGLLFYPEDEGIRCIRNNSNNSTDQSNL